MMKKRTTKKTTSKNKKGSVTEPVTVLVQRNFSGGELSDVSESSDGEVIAVRTFQSEVARVSVSTGTTKNLGAYESAKLSVTVSVPCYVEELDEAHEFASEMVGKFLQQHLDVLADSVVDEDDEGDDDDDDKVDEATIRKMKRTGLEKFIEEEELDVDPDDFKKVPKLKDAIVEAYFGEDEDDDEDDDDDDDDDEDEDDDDDDEDEDDDDDDDDEDDEDDEDDDDDEDEDEDEDDDDDDDDDLYTQEELEDGDEKELKTIYKQWELGKYPKNKSKKSRRKKAIKTILAAQDED